MSAPEYIMQLFTWIDEQIANPEIFPVEEGKHYVVHVSGSLFELLTDQPRDKTCSSGETVAVEETLALRETILQQPTLPE